MRHKLTQTSFTVPRCNTGGDDTLTIMILHGARISSTRCARTHSGASDTDAGHPAQTGGTASLCDGDARAVINHPADFPLVTSPLDCPLVLAWIARWLSPLGLARRLVQPGPGHAEEHVLLARLGLGVGVGLGVTVGVGVGVRVGVG